MPTSKKKKNDKLWRVLKTIGIILCVAILIYFLIQGRHYFTRRTVRQIQHLITSYGSWSPLVIIALILLSTVVPPLPIPIPLVEIVAGLIFGFWKGFFVVWVSQLVSSLAAFYMAKLLNRNFLKKFLENHVVSLYKQYLNTEGPLAVLITRATMSAPFNVVSFLAGISQINVWIFSVATIIGTIPEAFLYTGIGAIFKIHRFRLLYVFILSVVISLLGPVISYFMIRYIQHRREKNRKKKT